MRIADKRRAVAVAILWFLTIASYPIGVAQSAEKVLVIEEAGGPTPALGLVEDTSAIGDKWALLVGINEYAFPQSGGFTITPLRVCVRDVQVLSDLLTDPDRGNFAADKVFVLTDAQATRTTILMTLNQIARKAQPEDLVLIYFSGHGYHSGNPAESTYLIPYDADMQDPETTCIDFQDISSKIRSMSASKVVTFLDACHSGGVKAPMAKAVTSNIVSRYVDQFERSEGRPFLLSSDETEVSWEMPSQENSVFTHFLVRALEGSADTNNDGVVTFMETAEYVEQNVASYTTEHFARVQRPTRRYGQAQTRGDIPLVLNAQRLTELQQERQLAEYRSRIEALGSQIGTAAGSLRPKEVEEIVEFAVHAKSQELRGDLILDNQQQAVLFIEDLADGEVSISFYRSQIRRIYPDGLPAIDDGLNAAGVGVIRILTKPTGAAIYVDEKFMGYTPRVLNDIGVGRHVIRLSLSGEKAEERVIEVSQDTVAKVLHRWQ